ncbi:hypothetical protein F4778DRAFT_783880 [Xylariomycetidae sp. FL2044]|nr:hypothetical protein F4778DRAFT_783880 [Xylariomycetidae sp. FL2044]
MSSDESPNPMTMTITGSKEPYGTSVPALEVLGLSKTKSPEGTNQISLEHYSSLVDLFGYFEDSHHNSIALLRALDSNEETATREVNVSQDNTSSEIREQFARLPQRGVLDFLVQYFIGELNWIQQVVDGSQFLTHYQDWWTKAECPSTGDAEFAVLLVRICAYAAQFLPSPSFTSDKIRGMPLLEIRSICSSIGDSLAKKCLHLDQKGSLVRVQHSLLAALIDQCEGRMIKFWEGISYTCLVAQKAGLHVEAAASGDFGPQGLEKEMRRRILCVLYALDSQLSRQLDRLPFLPDSLHAEIKPQLSLRLGDGVEDEDGNMPDSITERWAEAQLGMFWRSFRSDSISGSVCDPVRAEQRYERFCVEFIPNLPPAFAFNPDLKWDSHFPKLAMQRQLLHISILDSICGNFRPLVLLDETYLQSLPPYKMVLHQCQKRRMAMAAIKELEAISILHYMLGGSQTRLSIIIFNTFEAAVLLLCLIADPKYPFGVEDTPFEILGLKCGQLTRDRTIQAVQNSLHRLKILAEASDIACSGAQILDKLFTQTISDPRSLEIPHSWPAHESLWQGTIQEHEFNDDARLWLGSETSNHDATSMNGTDRPLPQEEFSFTRIQMDMAGYDDGGYVTY